MAAQKKFSSTQSFTEILDIVDDIVLFTNGHASLVIEVAATNFSLLSKDEQDARIGAYASFLNSLSFPVQILVINKKIDISAYLIMLQEEINNNKNNEHAFNYMKQYKAFVEQLVKDNTVLDKHFYIAISFSMFETGIKSSISNSMQSNNENFLEVAKANLHTKAEGIRNQLSRINLANDILGKDDLVKLFAEEYGQI